MEKLSIVLILFLFICSQCISVADNSIDAMRCFDQGYVYGVRYYKTGKKGTPSAACGNINTSLGKAYLSGFEYVLQYGETKTNQYYQLRSALMLYASQSSSVHTKSDVPIVNTDIDLSKPESQYGTRLQSNKQEENYSQPTENQAGNMLIDTGIQALRSLIKY